MTEGSCTHPQVDTQNRCQRCGVQFTQVWRELGAARYGPLVLSLIITGVLSWLLVEGARAGVGDMRAFLLLVVFAYFLLRVIRSVLDLFSTEVTYGGRVESIRRRGMFSLFSTRDAKVTVGPQRFNLTLEGVRQIKEGEPVLFRYLRWTRTVMGIYKPISR